MNKSFSLPALLFLLFLYGCHKDKMTLSVFRELSVPVKEDLSAVWFKDDSSGVITGGTPWETGFILSTGNGGDSWQTDTLLHRKMECVMFDSSGQGYVCGQDIALCLYPGARHWLNFRTSYQWGRSCFFPNPQHGMLVSGESYRMGQVDRMGPEQFWQLDTVMKFPNELAAVWYSGPTTVHAVGIGWVMRSDDGGNSWNRFEITGDFFNAVHFPTATTGYICGANGTLLKTGDTGLSWHTIRKGGSTGNRHQPFTALWFSTADEGWLVGENGLFWHTGNGGTDWSVITGVPEDADFTDIMVRNGRGWLTAKNGRMFYFEQ